MKVLDLGAAPGGWSQILADKLDSEPGKESVFAMDILEMLPVPGVKTLQADLFDDKTPDKISQLLDF
jgi:23S rRNA (uridine2552-2'-O)-methyltransferase